MFTHLKSIQAFKRSWSSKARDVSVLMRCSWSGPRTPSNWFLTRRQEGRQCMQGIYPDSHTKGPCVTPPGVSVINHWKALQTQPCPVTHSDIRWGRLHPDVCWIVYEPSQRNADSRLIYPSSIEMASPACDGTKSQGRSDFKQARNGGSPSHLVV